MKLLDTGEVPALADQFDQWLARLDQERLARILGNRRTVLAPPWPRRISDLAARLADHESVVRALVRLPAPATQLAQALTVVDGDHAGVSVVHLAELLEAETAAVERFVEVLVDHALAFTDRTGSIVSLVEPVRKVWQAPLGLGAPIRDFLEQSTKEPLRTLARAVGVTSGGRKDQLVDVLAAFDVLTVAG